MTYGTNISSGKSGPGTVIELTTNAPSKLVEGRARAPLGDFDVHDRRAGSLTARDEEGQRDRDVQRLELFEQLARSGVWCDRKLDGLASARRQGRLAEADLLVSLRERRDRH